jgi:hypothetical protein
VSINYVAHLPPELYHYFAGQDADLVEFRSHIRRYNKAFAFTSSRGPWHLDGTVFDGCSPPTYKIQGELYHQISLLRPEEGHAPLYSQLYIYDPSDALLHRQNNNVQTCECTMAFLQCCLLNCNPFVTVYVQADALSLSNPMPNYRLRLDFLDASDHRRYNLPSTHHELAAIIPGDIDTCVDSRSIFVRERGGPLLRISEIHPLYVALHFPLLAPTGQSGWHTELPYAFTTSTNPKQKFVTYCDFLKHCLHICPWATESNHYFHAGFLFQEYVVDSWAAAEHSCLEWIRHNQHTIRAELYCGIVDALCKGLDLSTVGRKVILPSSFTSGPRFIQKCLQDTLALLRIYGGSDLFITFTVNPAWPEITEALLPGQSANDRPDIVARVFHLKVASLLDDIMNKAAFGEAVAYVYTVEYQKRGLPHIHLIVFLHPDSCLSTPERVDRFISTEFPDEHLQLDLYNLVKTHMVHGPCGVAHYSPCLNDKKECSKGFSKSFQEETEISGVSYVKTRRRDTGISVDVQNSTVDNQSVISYLPYLLQRYRAHINVECTTGFNAIKYIYKVSGQCCYVFVGKHHCSIFTKALIGPPLQLTVMPAQQYNRRMRCSYISTPDMSVLSRHMHDRWGGRRTVFITSSVYMR